MTVPDVLTQFEARARVIYAHLSNELAARDWRSPSKPWAEFFERFTTPKQDPHVIATRLNLNSHIYQTNYCIILGFALLYYVLRHPTSIFVIAAIIVASVYATSPRPIVINNVRVTRRQRIRALFFGSFFLLIVSGVLRSFLFVASSASTLIILHAIFRHTNVRQRVSDFRTRAADVW